MKKLFALILGSLMVIACENNEEKARLEIRLTDAPGDYEAVKIDIQGIEIHCQEGNVNSGWRALDVNTGVYNLLELTNGIDTLLSATELPVGKVSQIRLILGDNNSIILDGNEIELTTPGARHSGLKLNVHADLTEGITYKILLDFDAARSIVPAGNGTYNLKPVIRTITEAESGAIKGMVDPAASTPAVFAIAADDTVATTYADTAGRFLLKGVPAGTYKVTLEPKDGFTGVQKENVEVTTGNVTDLGTISFQ